MPFIKDTKGRSDDNSGYTRLFGNIELGQLFSRIHATVIRSGNELEAILWAATPYQSTQEALIKGMTSPQKEVIFRPTLPRSELTKSIVSDFLIVDHINKNAKVVEIKDGDTFDTKKSSGELVSMSAIAQWITEAIHYDTQYYFCSFNQNNRLAIVTGSKGRFSIDTVMTGREFCDLIGVDYDLIRLHRQIQQPANFEYFIRQMLKIDEVRALIEQILREQD